MKRIDATVDDEGNGRDDGHTRKRPQTPTPLRYCGQIIVDKSIGVNVLYPSKFPWKRYSVDRRSLIFPSKRYSCKRRSLVFTVLACWVYEVVFLLIDKLKFTDMFELNKFLRLPLGISEISGANNPQWIAAAASLAGSVAGSLFGGAKARKAAKKAARERQYRANAEKAWYEKAYNTDYLDTKAGQNLLRRAQEVQDNYIRKADGSAAVAGGTAASAAMAKEAANRTMGDAIANIGARDSAKKESVSAQHMQNQMGFSKEREDAYNQQAQNASDAGQNMSNALMNAASMLDGAGKKKSLDIDVNSPGAKAAAGGSLTPKFNDAEYIHDTLYDNKKLKNVTGV